MQKSNQKKSSRPLLQRSRQLAAWTLCVSTLLLTPRVAEAQFNPQGRRAPKASVKNPASKTLKKKLTASNNQHASREKISARKQTERLILRYQQLILERPEEQLPFLRLRELLQARDGSLQPFLLLLKQKSESLPHQLALARLLLIDGQTQASLALLKNLTNTQPQSLYAWLLLAKASQQTGQLQDTLSALQSALPLEKSTKKPNILRKMRELALDLNQQQKAQELHYQLVKSSAANYFLSTELAESLKKRGKIQLAQEAYAKVEQHISRSYRAYLYRDMAQLSLSANETERAKKYLDQAQRLATGGLQADIAALFLRYYRQIDQLDAYAQQLQGSASTRAQWFQVGELLQELGKPIQSEMAYREAIKLDPSATDERLALINLLELTGNIHAAAQEYQSVLRLQKGDIMLTISALELYQAAGEVEQAEQLMAQARLQFRGQADELLLLVDLAERFGMTTAIQRLEKLLKQLHSNDYQVLVELGERSYDAGNESSAFQYFLKAKHAHPLAREGLRLYVQLLLDHHANQQALDLLQDLLKEQPKERWLQQLMARAYGRAAATERAEERKSYNQKAEKLWLALLFSPRSSSLKTDDEAQRQVLRIWTEQDVLETKVRSLLEPWSLAFKEPQQKTTKIPRVDHLAARKLRLAASGLIRLKRAQEASVLLNLLIAQRPADQAALALLLRANKQAADIDSAVRTLEKLRSINPGRAPYYLQQMSQLYLSSGQEALALRYAIKAVDNHHSAASSYEDLGDLYLQSGQYKSAEKAFRQSLAILVKEGGVMSRNASAPLSFKLAQLFRQQARDSEAFALYLSILRTSKEDSLLRKATLYALELGQDSLRSIENHLRPLMSRKNVSVEIQMSFLTVVTRELQELDAQERAQQLSSLEAEQARAQVIDRSLSLLLRALNSSSGAIVSQVLPLLSYGRSAESQRSLINLALGKGLSQTSLQQRRQALLMVGSQNKKSEALSLEELARSPLALGQLNSQAAWLLTQFFLLEPSTASFELLQEFTLRSHSDGTLYFILALSAPLPDQGNLSKHRENPIFVLQAQIHQFLAQLAFSDSASQRVRAAALYSLSAPHFEEVAPKDFQLDIEKNGLLEAKDPVTQKLTQLALVRWKLKSNEAFNPFFDLSSFKTASLKNAGLRTLNKEEIFQIPECINRKVQSPENWVLNAGVKPLPLAKRLSLLEAQQKKLLAHFSEVLEEDYLARPQLLTPLMSASGRRIFSPFYLQADASNNGEEMIQKLHAGLQAGLFKRAQTEADPLYLQSLALLDVNSEPQRLFLRKKVAAAQHMNPQEQQALLFSLSRANSNLSRALLYSLAEQQALSWALRIRSLKAIKMSSAPERVPAAQCRRIFSLQEDASLLVSQEATSLFKSLNCSQ